MKIELHELTELPKKPGIYFIYSNENLIYIGKTINFSMRISLYRLMKEFLKFGVTHFYIFPYYGDLIAIEQDLIKMFDPPVNKHHTSRIHIKKHSFRHIDKFYEKIELELKNFYSVTPSDEDYLRFTHS